MKKTTTKTPVKRGRPAKRNRAAKAKLKAGKAVKAAGTRPKKVAAGSARKKKNKPTARMAKLKAHKDQCPVCKHEKVAEINKRILKCQKPTVIAADYAGLSPRSIRGHMYATGLDHERAGDFLNFCDEMVSRALDKNGSPSFTDAAKCAEMAAKVRGKLKPDESKLDVTIKLEKQVQKQMANLIAAIGGVSDGASIPK